MGQIIRPHRLTMQVRDILSSIVFAITCRSHVFRRHVGQPAELL